MGPRIAALALLLVGFLSVRPLAGASKAGWPIQAPAMVGQPAGATLLVLGLDRRGEEVARADAILLVRIGPPGEPTTVISIPRDLWVSIPGHGQDRINTAYTWGDLKGGGGASLARRTIEDTFNVRVDRVAALDFACFEAAIDGAGGVEVEVPHRIVDQTYPAGGHATIELEFEPGRQRMSGARALRYVRTRADDSDFARIRRQQQVVGALMGRLHDPGLAVRVATAMMRACSGSGTDLSPADLAVLAGVALAGGQLQMRMVTDSMVTPTTLPSGARVLMPRWEHIRPMIAETFRTED